MKTLAKAAATIACSFLLFIALQHALYLNLTRPGNAADLPAPINLFLVTDAGNHVSSVLDSNWQITYTEQDNRQLGLHILRDLELLESFGLDQVCGKPCYADHTFAYAILLTQHNFHKITKDIYLNTELLATIHNGKWEYSPKAIQCLTDFVRREIEYYVPPPGDDTDACIWQTVLENNKDKTGDVRFKNVRRSRATINLF